MGRCRRALAAGEIDECELQEYVATAPPPPPADRPRIARQLLDLDEERLVYATEWLLRWPGSWRVLGDAVSELVAGYWPLSFPAGHEWTSFARAWNGDLSGAVVQRLFERLSRLSEVAPASEVLRELWDLTDRADLRLVVASLLAPEAVRLGADDQAAHVAEVARDVWMDEDPPDLWEARRGATSEWLVFTEVLAVTAYRSGDFALAASHLLRHRDRTSGEIRQRWDRWIQALLRRAGVLTGGTPSEEDDLKDLAPTTPPPHVPMRSFEEVRSILRAFVDALARAEDGEDAPGRA